MQREITLAATPLQQGLVYAEAVEQTQSIRGYSDGSAHCCRFRAELVDGAFYVGGLVQSEGGGEPCWAGADYDCLWVLAGDIL